VADRSKIEWTDATWQIVTGCDIASPGCKNCYAMKLAGTRLQHHPSRAGLTQMSAAGPVWTGEVRFNEQWLDQPLRWRRPRKIFVAAHGDLFHPGVSSDVLDRIFAVMLLARQHTFQVLTKRPAIMRDYIAGLGAPVADNVPERLAEHVNALIKSHGWRGHPARWPAPNMLLGASVEDQRYADQRRPPMRDLAAQGWTTWVSYEPALERVDWAGWEFLRWLVAGGESGPGARPSNPTNFRAARDYCARNDVAFDFKQHGDWLERRSQGDAGELSMATAQLPVHTFEDGTQVVRVGKAAAGRLLDGRLHADFPQLA
jgi:protein gp37